MHYLTGQAQNYAWGSTTDIPAILGIDATSTPVAEYWWGAHASAPSTLLETDLASHLAQDPRRIGQRSLDEFGPRLPYLMKLLAANQALSIQAHPTRAQAEHGFGVENERGIALTARERTYKDDWPKPEIIVALTPMDCLFGFRDPRESAELFAQLQVKADLTGVLGPLTERSGEAGLAEVFLDVLSLTDDRRHFVDEIVAAAIKFTDAPGPLGEFARTAVELDTYFPGDPGIVAALLLNRVRLEPGEALFVPAGILHAYLKGVGVEAMANSDNVLRGGLTPKHIDVDELVRVVHFVPSTPQPATQDEVAPGLFRYVTPAPEFALYRLELGDRPIELPRDGARILAVVDGKAEVSADAQTSPLACGRAVFCESGEAVSITGEGTAFLCMPGV